MRKIFALALALFIVVNIVGCDAVQRKFTRKKKEVKPVPRLYQLKKYDIKPSAGLYSKHYAYWKSWMDELIQNLGDNRKKDIRCINEALSQLHDMQDILIDEKADKLGKHIKSLEEVRYTIANEELSQYNKSWVLTTLERESRYIKRDFDTRGVKDCIRESFDEAPPAPAVQTSTAK